MTKIFSFPQERFDGVLLPKLTNVQMLNLSNPDTALLIFNTSKNSFYYFNGSNWVPIIGPNSNPQSDLDKDGNSELIYVDGLLSRINYESGNYKTFEWDNEILQKVIYVIGSVTKTREFLYNNDGTLKQIMYSEA